MALKEYIGLARLTQAFSLLKSKLDGKEDTPTVISYDDFMALTPQQQISGYYLVVGGTPMTNAYGISYKTNKTVGDALDDHADAISELNADIASMKEYVEYNVPANSGKTWAQILTAVDALLDTSKITSNSRLQVNATAYHYVASGSGRLIYAYAYQMTATRQYFETVDVKGHTRFWSDINGTTITHGDDSSASPSVSLTIRVYY